MPPRGYEPGNQTCVRVPIKQTVLGYECSGRATITVGASEHIERSGSDLALSLSVHVKPNIQGETGGPAG